MYCLAHILILGIKGGGVPLQFVMILRGLENKEVEGKVRAVVIIVIMSRSLYVSVCVHFFSSRFGL